MKLSIIVTATLIFMVCAAGISYAQGISWDSQYFSVSAYAKWWDDEVNVSDHVSNSDTQSANPWSPPLTWPLNSSALTENNRLGYPIQYAESNASFNETGIDSYTITLDTRAEDYAPYFPSTGSDAMARATGTFDASFTATQSLFIFDYDLEYSISALGTSSVVDFESLSSNDVMINLSVYSNTTEEAYYYDELLLASVVAVGDTGGAISDGNILTGSISVPVQVGDNISVILELSEDARAEFASEAGNNTLTLNYSMAVAPEPISTVLFLAGGATFGFGAYRRKR
ncbi:MAG: PEP-CTERM sorting domain-containing protein [Candidatus Omnitrophica bacterium]|nr:PEP-CTERM sorting domain-containing protein [Candidatus Omnitrophota bacterium]